MINSKKDYLYYLEADRIAKAIPKYPNLRDRIINILIPNQVWKFQKMLRKLEYYKNCKNSVAGTIQRFFLMRKFRKLSYNLGFSIPLNVFGPGLSIAHHGTIIINGATRIGSNCRIHACVNIGSKAGTGDKAPQIGDNCYIGPGVKMFGDIRIANNIAIGANSVVNKSFTEDNIVIAGIPAKKIGEVDTSSIIIPATFVIDKGLEQSIEQILKVSGPNLTAKIKSVIDDYKEK